MAQDYTPAVQGAYGEGNGLMVAALSLCAASPQCNLCPSLSKCVLRPAS